MIGKYITGKKLMERWKIEPHELMHLVRKGLRPYHPVYGQRYDLYSNVELHGPVDLGPGFIEEWGELFPHLHDCLFLLSDVEKHDLDVSVTADSTEESPTQVDRKKADEITSENYFYREGNGWRIGFQGEKATFPDYKYIRYIANLLDKPNKPIAALELVHSVSGDFNYPGRISKKQAFDEGLSITTSVKDAEVTTKQVKDIKKLISDIEEETDPLIKRELEREYAEKVDALRKVNRIADNEGRPVPPPKRHRLDDPLSKNAQKSVKKELDTAYRALKKADLKKLAKHLEQNIKPAGYYDFSYRDADISWDIKL